MEPLDIEQLIPPDHFARNVWQLLGGMDLSRFAADIKSVRGHAGRNAWEPRLLIAMWIYAYSRGVASAREIERQCAYEPAFRWLTGLKVVNHHTLSDFRVAHGASLQKLFVQVLGILSMEKLITLERVTVDGTKVRACVNKKTFSKAQKISEHLKVARQHLETLQNEEVEQEKRTRKASARRRAVRERLERLETALVEIERLQAEKKRDTDKPCQASITDADAQFMRTSDHGLAPAYNVQLTTDAKHKLIVDVEVTKQPSDSDQLVAALDRLKARKGSFPRQAVADGDYTNTDAVLGAAQRKVDYYGSWRATKEAPMARGIDAPYHRRAFKYDAARNDMICPEGQRLRYRSKQKRGALELRIYAADREVCQSCPKRHLCTPQNAMRRHGRAVSLTIVPAALTRYHAKMKTEAAKAIYRQRAPVAEFPNAWLKTKLKWVRLQCQGLVKAQAEALWCCLTHNLQRYFKLREPQAA